MKGCEGVPSRASGIALRCLQITHRTRVRASVETYPHELTPNGSLAGFAYLDLLIKGKFLEGRPISRESQVGKKHKGS